MIDAIEGNIDLQAISRRACSENDLEAEICEALLVQGDLNDSLIKILKVDDFYNTRDFATPPKSIDCLIVVKCASGSYELILVELRDVKASRYVRPRDIIEKFRNTFERFLSQDFASVFENADYRISKVEAWLISDPFRSSRLSEDQYRRKIESTVLDAIQSARPFEFRDHRVPIKPLRPSKIQKICTC